MCRCATGITDRAIYSNRKLVFQFGCATRGKMMLRDQEKLHFLRQFRQSVGPNVPWAGYYTWGEIGPVEEHNDRHLYTSVVLALS
jgi:small ligand-binding sensory domain FIST